MNIIKRLLEAIKVKLSDSKSMKKYISICQKAFNESYDIITNNSWMSIQAASMLL